MRIRIDQSSTVPPYEQVRGQFAAMIGDGRLPVGTRLPAVRPCSSPGGRAMFAMPRAAAFARPRFGFSS